MIQKRALNILKSIINNPNISIKELSIRTNFSVRQINYSLESINYWLTTNGHNKIQKELGGQLILNNNTKIIINDLLKRKVEYVFNEEERQKIIFLIIFLNTEFVSLNHLIDILEVSKGTINDDLRKLNDNLRENNLKIFYSRGKGYQIKGNEEDIQYKLMEIVVELVTREEAIYVIEVVLDNTHLDMVNTFKNNLANSLESRKIFVSENNINIICFIFCILWIRNKNKQEELKTVYSLDLESLQENEVAIKALEKMGIDNKYNVFLLTSLLLSYTTPIFIEDQNVLILLDDIIATVLSKLKKSYAIIIDNKKKVVNQLKSHLRPALYRSYFNYPMFNPLKNEIIKKYGHLYTIIEEVIYGSEFNMIFNMSDDDIAYLTIHFATYISEKKEQKKDSIYGVIVCPNGIGISVLLKKELSELFPNITFLSSTSVNKIFAIESKVDVVFSTILVDTTKPLFLINPIMNNIEKVNLVNNFNKKFNLSEKSKAFTIKSLIKIIEKYAKINNEKGLYEDISEYLSYSTLIEDREEQDMLSEITNANLIQLNIKANDWKDAIENSAIPLIKQNIINKNYVNSMIENTQENGPYIVITKNVALPHARPEDGAYETAISISTLETPINFGHEENDPVKYIFCLSTVDSNSHLKALAELVDLLGDDNFYSVLDNSNNAQEIIDFIVKKEKEELLDL